MTRLLRIATFAVWIGSSAYCLYVLSQERDSLNYQIGKLEQKLDFSVRSGVDESGDAELRSRLASSRRSLASHNRACGWTLVSLAIAISALSSEFARRERAQHVQSAGDGSFATRPESGSEGGEETPTESKARPR